MRRSYRTCLIATLALQFAGAEWPAPPAQAEPSVEVPGHSGGYKTSAAERATRRAYDGAPPVIPHPPRGGTCTTCHNQRGVLVPEVGFAPPSPHGATTGMSRVSRCRQCHVFRIAEDEWRRNDFNGLRQDLRRGLRLHPLSPPVIPHRVFMRENCTACHDGAAAREEIRTSHPERVRCRQCHVEQKTNGTFLRARQDNTPPES